MDAFFSQKHTPKVSHVSHNNAKNNCYYHACIMPFKGGCDCVREATGESEFTFAESPLHDKNSLFSKNTKRNVHCAYEYHAHIHTHET